MRKWLVTMMVALLVLPLAACIGNVSIEIYEYDTRNFIEATGDVTPTAALSTINVDWVAGSVRVVAGNGSGVTARESGVGESANVHLYYRVFNDTLTIAFAKNGTKVRNISKSLVITVPQSNLPSRLTVNSVAATVNVEANIQQSVQIDAVSGRVECGLDGTQEVQISTVSGNINLRLNGSKTLALHSTSGGVNLTAQSMFDDLEAATVSGSVVLTLPSDADFTMQAATVSGKISTGEFACTMSGKQYICGVGGAEMDISTTSGNISLRKG